MRSFPLYPYALCPCLHSIFPLPPLLTLGASSPSLPGTFIGTRRPSSPRPRSYTILPLTTPALTSLVLTATFLSLSTYPRTYIPRTLLSRWSYISDFGRRGV
ncbi:hypothetical protein B0H14DRAFT_2760258 [Mycena olivaceomarginata]|nr:hypothetical protein B0H14DRAFT_2760258 [Mycena olivaceomarginata]